MQSSPPGLISRPRAKTFICHCYWVGGRSKFVLSYLCALFDEEAVFIAALHLGLLGCNVNALVQCSRFKRYWYPSIYSNSINRTMCKHMCCRVTCETSDFDLLSIVFHKKHQRRSWNLSNFMSFVMLPSLLETRTIINQSQLLI